MPLSRTSPGLIRLTPSAALLPMLGQPHACTSMASLGDPLCSSALGVLTRAAPSSSNPPYLAGQAYTGPRHNFMAELLRETWLIVDQQGKEGKCCQQVRHLPKRGLVKDVLLWLECCSIMMAVLISKCPAKAPELAAYQRTIIRAAHTYQMMHGSRTASATGAMQGRWNSTAFLTYIPIQPERLASVSGQLAYP